MTTDEEMNSTLDKLVPVFVNLIAARWKDIRTIAEEPNDKGESGVIKVAVAIEFDFTGKAPCGAVNVSIPPRPIKDGAVFTVDAEPELPL